MSLFQILSRIFWQDSSLNRTGSSPRPVQRTPVYHNTLGEIHIFQRVFSKGDMKKMGCRAEGERYVLYSGRQIVGIYVPDGKGGYAAE